MAFALFDKDGDGAITVSELLSVMHSLGFASDDAMVKKMIDRFDYDGENRFWSRKHFVATETRSLTSTNDLSASASETLHVSWLPGNGTLEFEEFLRMMTTRNKQGVTRWESSRQPRSEPEAWRAFKVRAWVRVRACV